MRNVPDRDMHQDDMDFGDDADIMSPADREFDAWIASIAPSVNTPPPTPSGEIWNAIQARHGASATAPGGEVVRVTPIGSRTRWVWPTAIAAALLVGIGVDRFAVRTTHDEAGSPTQPHGMATTAPALTNATRDSTNTDPQGLYRLAAVQTLTQAEALLTAYRAGNIAAHNPQAARQLGTWGREVLSSTRLLLDSPAGDDPQLRPLLNDIELVLVQVIQLSGAPLDTNDRTLIDRALRERDLLPRIRSAVPAGTAGTASDN